MLKILEITPVSVVGNATVQFIRIDPEDVSATLSEILKAIMDLSWLKNFDDNFIAQSYEQRAQKTVADIKTKFDACDSGKLTKDAGEYVVSELARVSDLSVCAIYTRWYISLSPTLQRRKIPRPRKSIA